MSSAVNVAATGSSAAAIPASGAAAKAPSGGGDQAMASAAAFRQWNEGSSIRIDSLRRKMRHHLAGPDEPDLGVSRSRAAAKTSRKDVGVFLAGDNPATSGNGDSARGDGVGSSDPRLAGFVKGGEGGSGVETVHSLGVGRRRSFPSLTAASTLARLEREAANRSIEDYVGDAAIFERSRVRRAAKSRRKLADWVKGAGVDDSDGDTNLSGASPRSPMRLSPAEISPLKPRSYRPRRAEHGGRAASLRRDTEPHSPTKRTLRRRRSSRPPSARQSAGQETGSFDAAGEAAAAAAAAAGGSGAEEEEEWALEVGRRGATEKSTEDKGGATGGGGGGGGSGGDSSIAKETGAMKGAAAEARPARQRGVAKAAALALGDGAVRARDQGEYPPRYDGKNARNGTGAREHESEVMVEGYQGAETPMASCGHEAAACPAAAPPTAAVAAAVAALPYEEEEEQDGKPPPGASTSASVVTSVTARDGATGVEAGAGGAGADSGDSFRDTAQQHQHQRQRGEPAPTTSSSHSLPPPVLVGAHGDSSGRGRVASFPLTGGNIGRSRRGMSSGGSASGSGAIGVGSGGSGSGGVGTGSGRRWRGERILTPGNLRSRRSLSSGGSKVDGGSTTKKALKEAREGCLSDGEDVEELSPIGREIAYIKEQRSSASKGDKGAGGLGLGAWPNMTKKETDSAKVIYLGDIEFDAPGEATATDILVRQHRTRVRVKRVKDKTKAKLKQKARTKVQRRRIRNGKPLHPEEDEVEYILTIGMMLGLRVAVGRQANPLVKPDLTVEDFYQVDKYIFPPSGATGYLVTPSHKLGQTFKFKDYAPKVFKKIREHFGVDKMRYMLSVAGNYNFLEFISNAKSGEFFFFSHDERFMIKTMKSSETKFLRKILPHYYEHVKVHPETFLVRFYGMYRVKMHHINRKVHFIVMNSMLDTYKEIHRTFDLKGSSLGRSAKPGEKVMKDNDLAEKQGKLHLGSQREVFLKVVRADSQFLSRMKIMDYSLLTGIHDRAKPSEDDQPQTPRRYSKFFTFADEAENRATPGFKRVPPLAGGDKKPSAEGSSRTVNLAQAEEPSGDDSSTSNNQSRRPAGALESVSDARAGKGDTVSVVDSPGEDEGLDVGVVGSDEDPTSGGMGSATGTGTGTEEDTGGDNTEGDGEYETPAETAGGPPDGRSLSRCSTAQGNLAQWHPSELPPKGMVQKAGGSSGRSARYKRSALGIRPTPVPRLAPPETGVSCTILRRTDGGIESEVCGRRGRDIYFMGIIDILQEYNARKHGETFFKSLAHDRAEISCVDPHTYCQRFNDFLERHTD